jgi:hypothetical protein
MKVQMKSGFQQMKLDRAEDIPDTWISKVVSLRRRLKNLGMIVLDENMILYLLKSIPKESM